MKTIKEILLGMLLAFALVGAGIVSVGCAAGDFEDVDTGEAEQATIASVKTENRRFYVAWNQYNPTNNSTTPEGSKCSPGEWGSLPGYGLIAGPRQLGDFMFTLNGIFQDISQTVVCSVGCGATKFCGFPGTAPIIGGLPVPSPGKGQYIDALFSTSSGSATGTLYTVNDVVSGSNRKGTRVLINSGRVFADSLDHGVGIDDVYRWIVCREIGRALGLVVGVGSNLTCMGNKPTTAAQYAARSFWSASELEEIRAIMLNRSPSTIEL
jgi:hypothetical protein